VREERFVESRRAQWAELRALVDQAQRRGLRSFSGRDARQLGARYRAATSDLAAARSRAYSDATVAHLNRLCVAAHGLVYGGRSADHSAVRAVSLFAETFPALVRRTWRWHVFAAAVAIGSGLVAYAAMAGNPDLTERTLGAVGAGLQQRAEKSLAMPDDARRYIEVPDLWMPVFSWGIMTNNIRVALMGFAFGAVAGVGTVALLIVQGVHIGGAFAIYRDAGIPGLIATFISAHGPFELGAIFIACGAGMRLGLSVLVPGRRTRAAAFRDAGLESVTMLVGVAAMLVVAGLIEGFLSPSAAPAPLKWGVGLATSCFLAWYFGAAGRKSGHAARPA
jgi:uncharacterized membrane protein SpoIIM required for sporulation